MAVTWHVGPFDQIVAASEAVLAWLDERSLMATGIPWEVYWTDPRQVPDTANWKTELVYPVSRAERPV